MSAIPSANFTATLRNTNGAPVVRIADTTPYPVVGAVAETRATATFTVTTPPVNTAAPAAFGLILSNSARSGTAFGAELIADIVFSAGDTTAELTAETITAAINAAGTGYSATRSGSVVTITDKAGFGATSNLFGMGTYVYNDVSMFSSSTLFMGGVNAVAGTNSAEDVVGYATVTQPDGITISIGSFAVPSISWVSGALTIAEGVLRLATDNNFQNGLYSITLYTRLAGYDDTTTTKTFDLDYSKPTAVLQPSFDLFTPAIRMQDSTSYAVTGLTLQSTTRSWTGTVTGVGSVSAGNVNPFDMVRSSNYYDALYVAVLTAVVQWQIAAATWVTVIDTITGTESEDAHAVADPDTLIGLLNDMFDALSGDSLCACSSQREQYVFAKTLFDHMMQRGRCGDTNMLYDMYRKLRMAINQNWTIATHDQSVLTAYDFNDFCGV